MKRILVTSSTQFSEELDEGLSADYIPFIRVEIYTKEQILEKIPSGAQSFIVTSKNAVKAIQDIELEGDFYVVGKNTAKELQGQNRDVNFVSNYAEDLLEKMLESEKTKYTYFKGNISLNTIPEALADKQIELIQVECYSTFLSPKKIEEKYDAVVFYSPSAVDSFFSVNKLPQDILIFTIGKTTAQEIKKYGNFTIYYPEETTHEALVELINNKFKD